MGGQDDFNQALDFVTGLGVTTPDHGLGPVVHDLAPIWNQDEQFDDPGQR